MDWTNPVYYLMGTDLNSNPNAYMVNVIANVENGNSDAQPATVYTERKGGPFAAMYAYGTNSDSDAVWNYLPDIIVGNGSKSSFGTNYADAEYAPAAGAANGDDDYDPYSITYDCTDINTMIDTLYNEAAAADQIVADSNGTKKLRYGSATAIAKQYEKYVKGLQGYILSQTGGQKAKTVALVENYDAASGTYTLVATGVAEGTASANRYLESVQNVAVNLGDSTTTVTAEELATVDLILLGSQSGSEDIASTEDILATFTTDMQNKTFWVNSATGSAGSCYGVVMNSVENAQNYARILGCLYDEYVDQDQLVNYYYDNFYHQTEEGRVTAIDNAMDGVRNWDATGADLTSWTEADATDYNEATVEAWLDAGIAYIQANSGSISSLLELTDNYGASDYILEYADHYSISDWAADSVMGITEKGLMSGDGTGHTFSPARIMSRSELCMILYRYAGSPASSSTNQTGLPDVEDNAWYTEAANWAVSNGVITGVNGEYFDPYGELTLDQFATILGRYLDNSTASTTDTSVLANYPDASSVEDWAANYVAWAVNNGIAGNNPAALDPVSGIARERAATILMNCYNEGLLQ